MFQAFVNAAVLERILRLMGYSEDEIHEIGATQGDDRLRLITLEIDSELYEVKAIDLRDR